MLDKWANDKIGMDVCMFMARWWMSRRTSVYEGGVWIKQV